MSTIGSYDPVDIIIVQPPEFDLVLDPVPELVIIAEERGPKGDPGSPGAASTVPGPPGQSYTYLQATPLAVWTIAHGLGHFVIPFAILSDGSAIEPDFYQPDTDTLIVTFSAPNTGAIIYE